MPNAENRGARFRLLTLTIGVQLASQSNLVSLQDRITPNPSQSAATSKVQDRKPEEQSSFSRRKKVTFDSNVKTYEPALPDEATELHLEKSEQGVNKEEALVKSSQSKSSSYASSVTSTGSCPPNRRYQNCRESDEEDEEMDCGVSDLSDEDSDMGEEFGDDFDDEIEYTKARTSAAHMAAEEMKSPIPSGALCESEAKPMVTNPNARDRSVFVHPVLNPVENLTQWKVVKAKRTQPSIPLKENSNSNSNQEYQIPFSSEPTFKERSVGIDSWKKSKQEIAVDTSLSNWLVSSETTPVNESSSVALYAGTPDRSTSQGSVISHEDRPILGALTVEEIKQFSASNSPRKSPSKSPDEMPIIGTVGTYWSHSGSVQDSGSVSSFKGIPNTTSKYREDKKVNWHSTPFETRLERALNRGAAGVATTHVVPSVF
ncbi:protein JASON [Prosopis cineraria]|uniref:protein JASON n=1 Tax=Prosopis cineraria TaxID=364024 RepID=UPI00240EE80D|nr:protein JASON [Prosopis cineraria]